MPRATRDAAAGRKGCAWGAVTLSGRTFQTVPLAFPRPHNGGPTTPGRPRPTRFGLCPVRSPLLGASQLLSLPPGTKMFQFPGFAPAPRTARVAALRAAGLPHSDIRGSQAACASPRLIAACRVLRRLPEPRHPPCALVSLRARRQRRAVPAPEKGRGGGALLAFHGSLILPVPACQRPRRRGPPRERGREAGKKWRITDSNR